MRRAWVSSLESAKRAVDLVVEPDHAPSEVRGEIGAVADALIEADHPEVQAANGRAGGRRRRRRLVYGGNREAASCGCWCAGRPTDDVAKIARHDRGRQTSNKEQGIGCVDHER